LDNSTFQVKTIIVKPASSSCNLHCSYCYNRAAITSRQKSEFMTLATAEKMISVLPELSSKRISIIWHGGEPLLRQIGFYRKVMEFQEITKVEHPGYEIQNSIMTNATLLNDEFIQFFKIYDWHVGVSLDGPEYIHNKYRHDINNEGSFELVYNNIKKLKEARINLGILSVITNNTSENITPFDFYTFMASINNNFDLLPCWEAVEGEYPNEYVINPTNFLDFIKAVFDIWWEQDNPRIKIRLLNNLVQGAIKGTPHSCASNGTCNMFLSIDADGSVYPCGKFAGIQELKMGNINTQQISEIINNDTSKFYLEVANKKPSKCNDCEWFSYCHNGCTYDRYTGNGEFLELSPYCQTWAKAYYYVEKRANETLSKMPIIKF